MTTEMAADTQSERSFVTYHVLSPAASLEVTWHFKGTQLCTLEEDIRALVNGGVWIIMNKGKIMIIINGLFGRRESQWEGFSFASLGPLKSDASLSRLLLMCHQGLLQSYCDEQV